jgi:hypothetical protein
VKKFFKISIFIVIHMRAAFDVDISHQLWAVSRELKEEIVGLWVWEQFGKVWRGLGVVA